MSQYGCSKCGSTGFAMEMRRAVVTVGAGNELQASGIVPVQRCLNDQCGVMSTASNLKIGDPTGLVPAQVPSEPTLATDEARKLKMASLIEMKEKIAALEGELIEPEPEVEDEPVPEVAEDTEG